MLDKTDIAGVVALLVRLIRVQDERKQARRAKEEAEARYDAADAKWRRIRSAFGAFGFDITGDTLWDEIRRAIGEEAWDESFSLARPYGADEEEGEETATAGSSDSAALPLDDLHSPGARVRDIALQQLREAGTKGLKASAIRQHIHSVVGRELHGKTVGMTLYRLSREGLVRREGHTWFAVPETVNPGGETPGLR